MFTFKGGITQIFYRRPRSAGVTPALVMSLHGKSIHQMLRETAQVHII